MKTVLSMMSSGGVLFFVIYLSGLRGKKVFCEQARYKLLITAMLLHVTPLIFLKLFFQICYARLNKSDYFLFASYTDRPAILATPEGFVYGNHAYLEFVNINFRVTEKIY